MQNSRFVVLTGHLRDYPLSDLVGILRHQRKTGRLTIEYPKGPGTFFFHDGELVDAQLNDLTGLQAICVALAQQEAAFNFNPLVKPSRRSIAPSFQRVVSELFGCWDESSLQIEGAAIAGNSERSLPPAHAPSNTPKLIPPGNPQPPQLLPGLPVRDRRRSILFLAAAAVVLVGLSTVIALSGKLNQARSSSERTNSGVAVEASVQTKMPEPAIGPNEATKPARISEQSRRQATQVSTVKPEPKDQPDSSSGPSRPASGGSSEQAKTPENSVASTQSVKVVMQIENGRVLKASIENHKPGMDSYERLALRIAKQRRYPAKVTGQESVQISVARPN
jgi:hypothetical protein